MTLAQSAASHAEDSPGLPRGAREFSRLLSAQKQWSELHAVFDANRTLDDSEWNSLRGYLRSVYAVSGDMEFMVRGWERDLRKRGEEVAKRFRATVKEMDKPAIAKNVRDFRKMHGKTEGIFDEFFALLKQASVGDIPDEL